MKMISGIGKKPWLGRKRMTATYQRGFTLLELLIVMSLLVVLSGMAFPNLKRTVEEIQFKSSVEKFYAVMDQLQERAMWERKLIHLEIDPERNEYRIYEHNLKGNEAVYAIGRDVRIASDKDDILFYPDGSIDLANITLADNHDSAATFITQGVFGGIKLLFQ